MITQNSKLKVQNYNLKLKTDVRNRAYNVALDTIELVDSIPRSLSTDVVAKQLIRAVTSIGANLVEAKSASSRRDFINFYSYALKSTNEAKFWFGLLKDTQKALNSDLTDKIQELTEIANMLASSILTMKGKKKF